MKRSTLLGSWPPSSSPSNVRFAPFSPIAGSAVSRMVSKSRVSISCDAVTKSHASTTTNTA